MAITYGMSVKEFWEDSPDLFWAYRFSYYKKKLEELTKFKADIEENKYLCFDEKDIFETIFLHFSET